MIAQRQESPLLKKGIYAFTAVVYILVLSLHYLPQAENIPGFAQFLPLLNASLNGSCSVLLILSLIAVKQKKIALHQQLNTLAMLLSVVFLLSYVLYHYFYGDASYGGENKVLYYFILISHILLAALSLPGILMAYYKGWLGDVEGHRKIVKLIYPVWLYVTITGVFVYLFLKNYYQF
jgi:putative membrane protein